MFLWPDLHVVAFLPSFGNLTAQGRCCRNFGYTLSLDGFFCRKAPIAATTVEGGVGGGHIVVA
jgi:hypothetical protein